MKKWLHKAEIIVDKSIPYLLVLLFLLIVGELFLTDRIPSFSPYVSIIDGIIISVFVADLCFKYMHVKNIPDFLRSYWLEIIAVFPAFLIVRVIEEFLIISGLEKTISLSQESLEIREIAGIKANRTHYFGRFIRPLSRLPRFLKAFMFYEKPHHKHI